MKTITRTLFFILFFAGTYITAQEIQPSNSVSSENYGNKLNLGAGIGYYGYIGYSIPVVHANFEFDVAKNFTLAPFISYYAYRNYHYWGDNNHPHKNYYYRQISIPVGLKGSYYFDQLLRAGSKWDFYLAASLGLTIRKTTWENEYYGETTFRHGSTGLYLDGHIGVEYHMNNKLGLFLDLSSGISKAGLTIQF